MAVTIGREIKMYIVRPDGSILCETAEEALALSRAIVSQPPAQQSKPAISNIFATTTAPSAGEDDLDLLRKLSPHVGKNFDAKGLAEITGVEESGVGSKLHWTGLRLKRHGIRLEDYLSQRRVGNLTRYYVEKAYL